VKKMSRTKLLTFLVTMVLGANANPLRAQNPGQPAPSAVAGQADVILVGGNILTGDPARQTVEAVEIAGDKIRTVGSEREIRQLAGPNTRVVNLRGRTVIPGLIDAHVHLLVSPRITDEPSLRQYEKDVLPKTLIGFLANGVTTVRSPGDPWPYIAEIRDRLERGQLAGPRLVTAGPVFTYPGGHPATTVCRDNPFCRQRVVREPENEEQARLAVRELVRTKVDTVKVVVDNTGPPVQVPLLSDAILRALVEETHRSGRRVIGHVTNVANIKRLAEMGFDEFVHMPRSPEPSEASSLATLLVARKIPMTTTLSLFDAYRGSDGTEFSSNGSRYPPGNRQLFEGRLRTARIFADAGVTLIVGTDWVDAPLPLNDPHVPAGARTVYEMELLRRAGVSTAVILAAATRNAAEALGMDDKVGTIAQGKFADLVILDGNPMEDLQALHRIVAVLKGGRVVHGALSEN